MLDAFVQIFTRILLPVLLLTGVGFLLQRRLGLDVPSLARLTIYLFVPALMFVELTRSELTLTQAGQIVVFGVALVLPLWLWSQGVARLRGYSAARRSAFSVTQMFYNSGNFGIPVNELAFGGHPLAAAVQVIVLTVQNILNFTLGLAILSHDRGSWRERARTLLRYPHLYALALALLVRSAGWPVWPPVVTSLEYLAQGLIPVALVTLGAQLALVRLDGVPIDVLLACLGRLLLGPLVGWALLAAMDGGRLFEQALLLSCAAPTAVNTTMLTIEFEADPEFASQVTFLSTVLSSVTVTGLLVAMGVQA